MIHNTFEEFINSDKHSFVQNSKKLLDVYSKNGWLELKEGLTDLLGKLSEPGPFIGQGLLDKLDTIKELKTILADKNNVIHEAVEEKDIEELMKAFYLVESMTTIYKNKYCIHNHTYGRFSLRLIDRIMSTSDKLLNSKDENTLNTHLSKLNILLEEKDTITEELKVQLSKDLGEKVTSFIKLIDDPMSSFYRLEESLATQIVKGLTEAQSKLLVKPSEAKVSKSVTEPMSNSYTDIIDKMFISLNDENEHLKLHIYMRYLRSLDDEAKQEIRTYIVTEVLGGPNSTGDLTKYKTLIEYVS